jgi:nucleotide-binding universal stress UspA family protein
MSVKNKILVPIDGSAFCTHIFPHLCRYFPPAQNEIVLLRVAEDPMGHVGMPRRPSGMEADLIEYDFPSRKDAVEARHPIFASQERESTVAELTLDMREEEKMLEAFGYDVHSEVRLDRARGEAIVQFIENHDVDIVAMTTHWRTGINKLIFGSVAQYVAQHISIPIVMIRPNA